MTIDHWLQIAAIASALIAPVLGAKLISRKRKPAPIPDANQPKKRIQVIADWIADKPKGFWLWFAVLIAFSVANMIWSMRASAPFERNQVAAIVMAHVLLAFVILILLVVLFLDLALDALFQIHNRAVEKFVEHGKELNEQNREWVKRISDTLIEHFQKTEPRPEGIIDKIKKLLP